jgi:glycosyltransferase involved in cell wall biosynthesis
MNQNPLISVIIPVYNGERYLAEAIESVLNQTYHFIELLVIDDGSSDRSAQIAKRFSSSVRCFSQPRRGAGAARNRGVDLSQGRYLAFLDADDIWIGNKLERQLAAFESCPGLDVVFSHVQIFHSPELSGKLRERLPIPVEIMPGYVVGTMLIERDAFLRVGPFGGDWELAEFIDWHARAMELGLKSIMLPEVMMRRRIHENNQGIYKREHRSSDYLRAIRAALNRRRNRPDTGNQARRQDKS